MTDLVDPPVLLPRPRRIDVGRRRLTAVDAASVDVHVDAGLPPEGHRIHLGPDGPRLSAADAAGAAHARRTLDQLRAADGRWPEVRIEDHPDLGVRGVMLDVSRDRVPTMDRLLGLVDQLAAWKLNHLQLYVEHTFTHPGHEDVWRTASPLTPEEVRALDVHARTRHMELVANQNTLGHMARFLTRDRYRHLALEPDGFTHMGLSFPPMTLDPAAPGAWELASGLARNWTEVLAEGARLHVGLDEPFELPAERVGEYAGWIARLRAAGWAAGRELLVWGDVVARHRWLLDDLPEGVTVCEWGYEHNHPWASRLEALAEAGTPRWVCPGTSSWDSLLGRHSNMAQNVGGAVDAALADGGVAGLLMTDWGDWGHLQPPEVSLPGFAWAAAQSWCREANRDLDLAAALDATAAGAGPGFGAAVVALADAHSAWPAEVPNVAAPFLHLWLPQLPAFGGTRDDVEAVRAALRRGLGLGEVGESVRATVALAELVLDDAAARLEGDGSLDSVPATTRIDLAARAEAVIDRHAELWRRDSRPGGLSDSLAWLRHWRDSLRRGAAPGDWGGPLSPGRASSGAGPTRRR